MKTYSSLDVLQNTYNNDLDSFLFDVLNNNSEETKDRFPDYSSPDDVWFDDPLWSYVFENKLLPTKEILYLFNSEKKLDLLFDMFDKRTIESLKKSDVYFLLSNMQRIAALIAMIRNESFMKRLYDDCLLNKNLVNKLHNICIDDAVGRSEESTATDNLTSTRSFSQRYGYAVNFFDLVDYVYSKSGITIKYSESCVDLLLKNAAYKYVFSFTGRESNELLKILKENRLRIYRIAEIVKNNLEGQYDFDQLRDLIESKQTKLKLNL